MKGNLHVGYLPGVETLVISKDEGSNIFILTPDSIIISKKTLLIILNYMVKNNVISPKSLEGILEEYNTK